jgi:ABC-2 type transport system ATP-binding protein
MQRGSLIAEDEPLKLLEESGEDSLEDAFLVFSKRDKNRRKRVVS